MERGPLRSATINGAKKIPRMPALQCSIKGRIVQDERLTRVQLVCVKKCVTLCLKKADLPTLVRYMHEF